MSPISQAIILDVLNLALLALAVGVPAYAWVRRHSPLANWERAGNVWTGPFQGLDLLVVVMLLLAIRMMAAGAGDKPSEPMPSAAQVVSGSMVFVILAGGLLATLAIRRVSLTEALGLDRLSPRALLLWSVGGAIAAIAATQGFAWLWQKHVLAPAWTTGQEEQSMVTLLRESKDQSLRLAIAFSACLLQPVTEEIVFRGYIYPAIKKHSDKLLAGCVSALVFAAMHFHVPTLGPLFFLGLLLVAAYEMTGSLWVPVAIHSIFNTSTVVYQIVHG